MENSHLALTILQTIVLIVFMYFLLREKKSSHKSLPNETTPLVPQSEWQESQRLDTTKKDACDTEKIDEIIFENLEGEQIKFIKITDHLDINNYERLPIGNREFIIQSTLPVIAQTGMISALMQNGIFTATVSPHLLTRFKDGTFSTMIKSNGKIVKHAGFQPASSNVFTSILIFQLLSFLTGQYYLHGISKQLEAINHKIDKLIKYHKTSWQGDIFAVARIMNRLITLKYPNIEDLVILKNCEEKLTSLFESQLLLLKEIDPIKMPESFFTKDKLSEIKYELERKDFNFHFRMVLNCEKLIYLLKLIELFLNIKLCKHDKSRIDKVEELIEEIKSWDKFKIYTLSKGKQQLEVFYNDLIKKLNKIYDEAWINHDEVLSFKKECESHKQAFIEELDSKNKIIEKSKVMIKNLFEPQQLLIQIEDGNLYMLQPKEFHHTN